ncbi:hypothetical protein AB0J66_39335, partial [Actinoplanes sp. NPDC049598]|uniref:hypothetical protein n=1 Tax=Actinoplanes sp. NPDC049598 TaxID=3154626 RepID=UPI003440D9AA
MTTVNSAVDLVSELPAGRALVAFAGACGQRAAGLWTAAEDPRLAGLLREALAATWRCAESQLREMHRSGQVELERAHPVAGGRG